jgi:hypothetical protein
VIAFLYAFLTTYPTVVADRWANVKVKLRQGSRLSQPLRRCRAGEQGNAPIIVPYTGLDTWA